MQYICEVNAYMHCEIPSTVSGLVANYHFNQGYNLVGNQTINTLTDAACLLGKVLALVFRVPDLVRN